MSRRASLSAENLPALAEFHESGKKNGLPTRAFAERYKAVTDNVKRIFPVADNSDVVYAPESPADFIRLFHKSPAFHKAFAQEFWTLLQETETNGNRVNGKKLHDHQIAHAWWMTTTMARGKDSPHSIFLEGAPGTGKTLELGIIMTVLIRMQMRGVLDGAIAYLTAKSYHLSDKVRGKEMGKRRVLRAPPYGMTPKEFAVQRRLFEKMDPFYKHYIGKETWERLLTMRSSSAEEILSVLLQDIDVHGLRNDFRSEGKEGREMLRSVARVVEGSSTLVSKGLYGHPDILHLSKIPHTREEKIEAHTGDAAFSIPADYDVFSRESVGISTADRAHAKILLESATLFTSAKQVELFQADVHSRVRVILCDEAQRREPVVFQEPVLSSGEKDIPIVIAAGSRWHGKKFDARSPRHSFVESIRRGVLPNIGVRTIPSAQEIHYPSETREAVTQLIDAFFTDLPYFKKLHLPQPYAVNTLFGINSKLFDTVVEQLREGYEKRRMKSAEVHIYAGTDTDKEALREWFNDSDRGGPHVLVAAPSIVQESGDFPLVRHVVMGTTTVPERLFHMVGRLAHGRDRRSAHDRMLITMQQFANSNLHTTPFTVFDHGLDFPEESFRWIPGHALMNQQAFHFDQKKTKGKERSLHAVQIPSTARRKRTDPYPIIVQGGQSLIEGRGYVTAHIINPATTVPGQRTRRIPMVPVQEDYNYKRNGPPTQETVMRWAGEFGEEDLARQYGSIFSDAMAAYRKKKDPRRAVQNAIARIRERGDRLSDTHAVTED